MSGEERCSIVYPTGLHVVRKMTEFLDKSAKT